MAKQVYTAGQVLTASQMSALQANDYNQTVSTKTANYVLVASDVGTRIVMNAATATTITVNTSLFAAGDTLEINNIGAGVCTVTAGTCTVSSAGPLYISANGGGKLVFISTSTAIWFPNAVNRILQVVYANTTTGVANSTNVYVDTNLTATITPQSTSSKILVYITQSIQKSASNANNYVGLKLQRNGSDIFQITSTDLFTGSTLLTTGISASTYLDSPTSTSALTYKTQIASPNNTAAVAAQPSSAGYSTIVLVEVSA